MAFCTEEHVPVGFEKVIIQVKLGKVFHLTFHLTLRILVVTRNQTPRKITHGKQRKAGRPTEDVEKMLEKGGYQRD
ncbi:hypothetical protein IFM47457_09837 [Aspergillus lentulus]|nr:hypothetical protein IFM47457_09837 [Aspergillus lentulus]